MLIGARSGGSELLALSAFHHASSRNVLLIGGTFHDLSTSTLRGCPKRHVYAELFESRGKTPK